MRQALFPVSNCSIPDSTGNVIGLMLTPSIQSTYSSCEEFVVRNVSYFKVAVVVAIGRASVSYQALVAMEKPYGQHCVCRYR